MNFLESRMPYMYSFSPLLFFQLLFILGYYYFVKFVFHQRKKHDTFNTKTCNSCSPDPFSVFIINYWEYIVYTRKQRGAHENLCIVDFLRKIVLFVSPRIHSMVSLTDSVYEGFMRPLELTRRDNSFSLFLSGLIFSFTIPVSLLENVTLVFFITLGMEMYIAFEIGLQN